DLFWDHARRLNRLLLYFLWNIAGGVALLASVVLQTFYPGLVWLAASLLLFLAFVVRSRSLTKPLRLMFDWSVSCWPLLRGRFLPCRDARHFCLDEAITSDTPPHALSQCASHGVQQSTDSLGSATTHAVLHTATRTPHV